MKKLKSKIILLCIILVSSITIHAQSPQISDENSNTWDFLETVQGTIWDDIMFQNTRNPWAARTSTSGLYSLWGKMYIYYRQIGNKMLFAWSLDTKMNYITYSQIPIMEKTIGMDGDNLNTAYKFHIVI